MRFFTLKNYQILFHRRYKLPKDSPLIVNEILITCFISSKCQKMRFLRKFELQKYSQNKIKTQKRDISKIEKVPGKPLSIQKRFDRTKGREMEFGSYWIVQHAEFKKRVKRTRWNGRISKRCINVAIVKKCTNIVTITIV